MDPFAAHEAVMKRAEQLLDRRGEEHRSPLPENAHAEVCFFNRSRSSLVMAEVLELSAAGMRLAAFADQPVEEGERCEIKFQGCESLQTSLATVRWIKQHPLIQVFGVEFDQVMNQSL